MRRTATGTETAGVTSRRSVILGSGAVLAGAAACSSDDGGGNAADTVDTADPTTPEQSVPTETAGDEPTQPNPTPTDEQTEPGTGGEVIGSTSDVPVGGGTVFAEQQVVVVQPSAGEFRAYTAVCTHQACLVDTVADGEIRCPCHGSRYSAADGSVIQGPAPQPLAEQQITVDGDSIVAS